MVKRGHYIMDQTIAFIVQSPKIDFLLIVFQKIQ